MKLKSCISNLLTAVLPCYYPATTLLLPLGVKEPTNHNRGIFDALHGQKASLTETVCPMDTTAKQLKRYLTLLSFVLLSVVASAQILSVASFNELPNDLDARANYPKTDPQTGKKYAIIKIVTTQDGFTFDIGQLAVGSSEKHTSEIWVYVPEGTKKLKIEHPQLGQLKTSTNDGYYWFPQPIKSATCYRLELVSGTITTVVEAPKQQTGWLILSSTPSEADVYLKINGVESLEGKTPFQKKMAYGNYDFRLRRKLYHDEVGTVKVDANRVEQQVTLRPAHGTLQISSTPSGALVDIEGVRESYTTPCTTDALPSGQYQVSLSKAKYASVTKTVTVSDGQVTPVQFDLAANFAKVTVNTLSGADIYLNGSKVSTTTYSEELTPGLYDFEVQLASHRTMSRQVEVKANQPQTLTLNPMPIYGSLDVITDPMNATVTINGKDYGKTPTTIDNLLIGHYHVELTKEGYGSETATVTIEEGKTAEVNRKLSNGREPNNDRELTFNVNGVSFTMVKVEGGTFTMGATSEQGSDVYDTEKPTHKVTLSTYSIGQTEVTQALWKAVMGNNPSYYKGDNLPVEKVSWDDCQEFIRKLNQLTGKKFRLPTEAEWEYAARGGNKGRGYKYAGSNTLGDVAWYTDNSGRKTHTVGSKKANELGLFDMSGNVYEWCQDWYGNYSSGSQTNPTGPTSGSYRVHRGGSWCGKSRGCRVSYHGTYSVPSYSGHDLGLRLVLSE